MRRYGAGLAAAALLFGTPAAAASRQVAPSQPSAISPWVALSALGGAASSTALCASMLAAANAAGAAQAPGTGCVLPAVDAPPAVASQEVPVSVAPPAAATASGFGVLPLLLGLTGIAVLAALVFSGGDDESDRIDLEPVSP